MSSAPPPLFADDLKRDARWLAQALEAPAGALRFVAMSSADYRAASFLDDRLFDAPHDTREVELSTVVGAMAGLAQNCRWIFHIGHVGSTLVARLLGDLAAVLSIREPRLLRDLLAIPPAQRAALAPTVRSLYSRTGPGISATVVKATSFVSEIAGELLLPDGRALLLTARPGRYIAGILAGENSSQELTSLAATRATLLGRRTGPLPPARHLADLAAIGWACAATALEAASDARPAAILTWLDFDDFLGRIGPALRSIAAALDLPADDAAIDELAHSPLLGRYSKALEFDYSADLRERLIADASRHYEVEIDEALAMLDQLATGSPLLERALARSKEY